MILYKEKVDRGKMKVIPHLCPEYYDHLRPEHYDHNFNFIKGSMFIFGI